MSTGAKVQGLPSKRLGLFAEDNTIIVRSDSNGEDLESFAGAGALSPLACFYLTCLSLTFPSRLASPHIFRGTCGPAFLSPVSRLSAPRLFCRLCWRWSLCVSALLHSPDVSMALLLPFASLLSLRPSSPLLSPAFLSPLLSPLLALVAYLLPPLSFISGSVEASLPSLCTMAIAVRSGCMRSNQVLRRHSHWNFSMTGWPSVQRISVYRVRLCQVPSVCCRE